MLGFSLVVIALGAAGSLVSTASVVAANPVWLMRIGGALLIVLGLHQLGIVRIPFLERERRFSADGFPAGQVTSSFLVGVTFAAGWSPCVGPILGAILTMAAGQGSVDRAAVAEITILAVLMLIRTLRGSSVSRAIADAVPITTPIVDRWYAWDVFRSLPFAAILTILSVAISVCTINRAPGIWQAIARPSVITTHGFLRNAEISARYHVSRRAPLGLAAASTNTEASQGRGAARRAQPKSNPRWPAELRANPRRRS